MKSLNDGSKSKPPPKLRRRAEPAEVDNLAKGMEPEPQTYQEVFKRALNKRPAAKRRQPMGRDQPN